MENKKMRPEYLFKISVDEYVYVTYMPDNCKFDSFHKLFRLFIGTINEMVEQTIVSVSRMKDGGSTLIKTDELALSCPFANREAFPTIIENRELMKILNKTDNISWDLLQWTGRGIVKLDIENNQKLINDLNLIM